MTTDQLRQAIREEFSGEDFRSAVRGVLREELRPIERRLTKMQRDISTIASGQVELGYLVNTIHERVTEQDQPWKREGES